MPKPWAMLKFFRQLLARRRLPLCGQLRPVLHLAGLHGMDRQLVSHLPKRPPNCAASHKPRDLDTSIPQCRVIAEPTGADLFIFYEKPADQSASTIAGIAGLS